jgi:hypothetical protein
LLCKKSADRNPTPHKYADCPTPSIVFMPNKTRERDRGTRSPGVLHSRRETPQPNNCTKDALSGCVAGATWGNSPDRGKTIDMKKYKKLWRVGRGSTQSASLLSQHEQLKKNQRFLDHHQWFSRTSSLIIFFTNLVSNVRYTNGTDTILEKLHVFWRTRSFGIPLGLGRDSKNANNTLFCPNFFHIPVQTCMRWKKNSGRRFSPSPAHREKCQYVNKTSSRPHTNH